ncbi:MAG: UDP-2,3-diacylglucosamine diphosphatase [Desulfuromonas sp.]|nr:MAG: UDP-2,3-diacylglucosamine diphosphatase [Desulfuromonas sp.]
MRDLFIADAHLRNPQDENYRRLLSFLSRQGGEIRTLFLLGDIFQFWIGRRFENFAPYQPMLQMLRQLQAGGTKIVYVEGNHDFYLAPYFAAVMGCTVLPDGGDADCDGLQIHVAHGDLVDPDDTGYHKLRRLLRSRLTRFLAHILPVNLIWRISEWGANKSAGSRAGREVDSAPREKLINHARPHFENGCAAVITGHFHQPLCEKSDQGTIIALGDWITQYSYAVCEDGKFRLETDSGE